MVIKLHHFTEEEAGAPGSTVLWENPGLLIQTDRGSNSCSNAACL